jgi:hypothetical protein
MQTNSSNFSLLLLTAINKKGEKTVTITMLVNKNWWFTVILCIGLNGRKLKLYIVLKRKTLCKVMYWDTYKH